jgi:hypothetical protein
MSYDSMLVVEGLMLVNPKLEAIRRAGNRPNKTNLVKMALMHFFATNIKDNEINALYEVSENDILFQQSLSGESTR